MITVFYTAKNFVVFSKCFIKVKLVSPTSHGLSHSVSVCAKRFVHVTEKSIFRELEKGSMESDVGVEILSDLPVFELLARSNSGSRLVVDSVRGTEFS